MVKFGLPLEGRNTKISNQYEASMREILRSSKLPGPKFNYSPCVKVGPIFQVAGLVGINLDSGKLVEGGPEQETAEILMNLGNALDDFGLTWDHLYSARLFTTKFDQF
jgi:2-iminobutanoate/2-iminopropanoate deaminase